jgi:ribonuclease HII
MHNQLSVTYLDLLELTYSQKIIAGVDEVGRGCLFGPVVAAAVILPSEILPQLLTTNIKDSKQLSALQRSKLYDYILSMAIDCKIGIASVKEIDRINILNASLLAMKRAVLRLNIQPELCLVDGNQKIKNLAIAQETIIKGDQRSLSIAAASIIAKVWRDRLIVRLGKKYPEYDLENNKGYGTKNHLLAIEKHGISAQHRNSFAPCQQLSISF